MKTCENCDHDCVCGLDKAYGDECKNWSGWISIKEELPKQNMVITVTDGRSNYWNGKLCYPREEESYLAEGIVAWRELTKYEGSKK